MGKDVRHITIPQYKSLKIEKIAEFVSPYNKVGQYLPDPKEIPKLPKQWIANICNTVLKDIFSAWVKE